MFTFLPREYRTEVESEYRKRLFAVVAVLLATLVLVGAVLAVPAYAVLWAKKNAAGAVAQDSMPTITPAESADLDARVSDIQTKIAVLKGLSGQQNLVSILERVTAHASSGISLTGLSLKRGVTQGSISIAGVASTRAALVAFTKGLESEAVFPNVSLPVSSLAKATKIPFTISVDARL